MKISKFLLILMLILSLTACSGEKEKSVPKKESKKETLHIGEELTIVEYVDHYNENLRSFVEVPGDKGTTNEKYIECAKSLISKDLVHPSTAVYNEAKIKETDGYGRAIVYLDISAQNVYGGWSRVEYYVCIQSIASDGTYTYDEKMPYFIDDYDKLYSFFKGINNFGVDPVDVALKGFLLDRDDFEREELIIEVTPERALELYTARTNAGKHYLYVDSETLKIVSAGISISAEKSDGYVENMLSAFADALSGEGLKAAKNNIACIFDSSKLRPTALPVCFSSGYVYDCSHDTDLVYIYVTAADKESYDAGFYWTPNHDKEYFELLADKCVKEKNLDKALIYYKAAKVTGEKLKAVYYSIADERLAKGDLQAALDNFKNAGDYKDSKSRISEVYYLQGVEAEEKKDFGGASICYYLVGDHSDAETKYKECQFKLGEEELAKTNYFEAIACFEEAGDYGKAAEKYKEANYLCGEMHLEIGAVDKAREYFEAAEGYADANTRIQRYYYEKGEDFLKKGDWLNAVAEYEKSEGYADSSEKILECYHYYAINLDWQYCGEEAKEYFSKCGKYMDSDQWCVYVDACAAFDDLLYAYEADLPSEKIDEIYLNVIDYFSRCEAVGDNLKRMAAEETYNLWKNIERESSNEATMRGMSVVENEEWCLWIRNSGFVKSGYAYYGNVTIWCRYPDDLDSFGATISGVEKSVEGELKCTKAVCALIKLLTDISDTSELETKMRDGVNWSGSKNKKSFTASYDGYTISVTVEGDENYSPTVSIEVH